MTNKLWGAKREIQIYDEPSLYLGRKLAKVCGNANKSGHFYIPVQFEGGTAWYLIPTDQALDENPEWPLLGPFELQEAINMSETLYQLGK